MEGIRIVRENERNNKSFCLIDDTKHLDYDKENFVRSIVIFHLLRWFFVWWDGKVTFSGVVFIWIEKEFENLGNF